MRIVLWIKDVLRTRAFVWFDHHLERFLSSNSVTMTVGPLALGELRQPYDPAPHHTERDAQNGEWLPIGWVGTMGVPASQCGP